MYTFRGAQPQNLDAFQAEYKPTVYYLLKNYRSHDVIVRAATDLIRNNPSQPKERPYSARNDGRKDKIEYWTHDRETHMADVIASNIATSLKKGTLPQDIAILYRVNRIGKALEPALLKYKVPYHIKKGIDLLGRMEVKMLISIGRLVVNPHDSQALNRLSTLIPGLGAKGISSLIKASRESGTDLWKNLHVLKGKSLSSMKEMKLGIANLKLAGPEHLLNWALKETIFKTWLKKEALKTAKISKSANQDEAMQGILKARIANLKVLQVAIMARLEDVKDVSIEEKWSQVIMDLLPKPPDEAENEQAVTLSTVHSAKGLQWEHVYIAGFSDGLIPLKNGETDQVNSVDDERCLAYVALTRAQNRLYLHHTKSAVVHGTIKTFPSSRFLKEFGSDENMKIIAPDKQLTKSYVVQEQETNALQSAPYYSN